MRGRVSRPPNSGELLRRLVADEFLKRSPGIAIDIPTLALRLSPELPADVSREEIVAAIVKHATTLGLAVEFGTSSEQDEPSRDSSDL